MIRKSLLRNNKRYVTLPFILNFASVQKFAPASKVTAILLDNHELMPGSELFANVRQRNAKTLTKKDKELVLDSRD